MAIPTPEQYAAMLAEARDGGYAHAAVNVRLVVGAVLCFVGVRQLVRMFRATGS